MYKRMYTSQARKDYKIAKRSPYIGIIHELLDLISLTPYANPPYVEKLSGNLDGAFSRRINKQHRLVYDILPNDKELKDANGVLYDGIVKVLSMWTHYE